MHEAGMVDRILEVVLARAAEADARRVTEIHLQAGPLSGVSEEALRFHWAEHAAGTAAEGAELRVSATDDLVELRLLSIDVEGSGAVEGGGGGEGDGQPARA
ncbi:MAG: hydrogenase/urease maturation nickel metallochaperone HypA [Chloroflexota bacterium]